MKNWKNLFIAIFAIVISVFSLYLSLRSYPKPEVTPLSEENSLSPAELQSPSQPQYPILFTSKGSLEARVIYNQPSAYGQIVVFDYADYIRSAMIDGNQQCTWNFGNKVAATHVHEVAQVLKNYLKDRRDILIVGLGCGGLLKELGEERFDIDVVEINPKMVKVAEQYFLFPQNLNFQTYTDDGLHFLRNIDKRYDIIIVDLCDILESNVHLYTQEFYGLVNSKLKDESSFFIQSLNIYRQGNTHHPEHRVANSILKHFHHLYITDRVVEEEEFAVLNFYATNNKIESEEIDKISFIPWESNLDYGYIDNENALMVVQHHLPTLNELREQAITNFGFDIRLK